jgi:ribonuclease P/MRP protein subunit RPP1
MDALALAEICGLEEDEAIDAMSTVPEKIISKKRPRTGYIREGVEVLEDGDYF